MILFFEGGGIPVHFKEVFSKAKRQKINFCSKNIHNVHNGLTVTTKFNAAT